MHIIAYLLIAFLLAVLAFRWLWASYMKSIWEEVVVMYVSKTGARSAEVIRLVETWPLYLIVLTFWRWNYRDFLVNQDDVSRLLGYFEQPEGVIDDSS